LGAAGSALGRYAGRRACEVDMVMRQYCDGMFSDGSNALDQTECERGNPR
jgi:hypothetical protein